MNNDSNEQSGVEMAIGAGIGLAKIADRIQVVDGIPVALVPGSMEMRVMKDVLTERDTRAERPLRLKGTASFTELDSFNKHVLRFKDEFSVIFADNAAVKLTAVLNYHDAEGQRWADHRSVYTCPLSDQWKLWTANSGKMFPQEAFGEFIEANMRDLAAPAPGEDFPQPATVLEMARNLVIRTKGEFSKKIDPTTGNSSLVAKTENGEDSTKIPRAFKLGIQVFDAGEFYSAEARLRLSMPEGRPCFSYVLFQPDLIKRDAFNKVREVVAGLTALPIYAGSPEQ